MTTRLKVFIGQTEAHCVRRLATKKQTNPMTAHKSMVIASFLHDNDATIANTIAILVLHNG